MLDGMTFDQLRMLVAVSETGSFSAAGRRVSRVQSSVSQAIQALERQLRVQIFDRSTKVPQLTDAGRSILMKAQEVLAYADDLQAHAAAISSGVEPELTIAIDSVFPSGPLAASLRALDGHFPGLPVTLYTEMIGSAERRLREGVAQIGLYGYLLGSTCGLEGVPIIDVPMIPVAAASHPLAGLERPLERRDLESHVQLILTDGITGSESDSHGVVSSKIWRFADLARRLDFLLEGFGWGSMPVHLVEDHVAAGRLVELHLADRLLALTSIPIHAVHPRGKPPGPAGRWLIEDLARRLHATRPGEG